MSTYPFDEIEKKWQKYWEDNQVFAVSEDPSFPEEKRKYVLDMFPYPSGSGLHVGHPEGYTATDIYCRYLRMNGYNVLHPMGFDSFGLPAENYAIKTGTHPRTTTEKNIENFRRQIKRLGFSYDWNREVATHTPEYYRWTQWIFLQLYKKNLAYEAEMPINWCPDCLTGLSNEEVKEGKCERCGSLVTRKNIRQWLLKITEYAQRLLDDLENLNWSESIKAMQTNWIGKSEGALVKFPIENSGNILEVYTTRSDTLFGATYMVVSPEHPLIPSLITEEYRESVQNYIEAASHKSDLERTDLAKDKTGVFSGSYAINPVNNQRLQIWIADYVLINYGTGAIMAVPAHDTRDWEFAKKFNLPIVEVLKGDVDVQQEAWVGDGLHVNSQFLDGLNKEDAINKMDDWLEANNKGCRKTNFKLRDWLFSRQRYWGEPIPLVHCPTCGIVALDEKDLPLMLPEVESYAPSGTGESPLATITDWVNTICPTCNGPAKRETNTMPQWAGSCWYYLRYLDPHNDKQLASKEAIDYWMPVDLYVGGAEHAVLHLLYARFWHKVLYDLNIVDTVEPFSRLVNQGMITSFAFQRPDKSLVATDEVTELDNEVYVERATGQKLERVVAKMSKSLKNVINPDEIIALYGADAMRTYEMFMGPLEVSKPWSTAGIGGVYRFLERLWRLSDRKIVDTEAPIELKKTLHKTIKKVTHDTGSLDFNTAIAQMMIMVNELYKVEELHRCVWEPFILIVSPYVPHLAEQLWEKAGNSPSVVNQKWPSYKEELTVDDEIELVVQINGKVRAKMTIEKGLSKETLLKLALDNERIKERLENKEIIRSIVVVDKLVNIVVRD
ncbi:MAG: leucine--tRNA ligase [Sphaerochaetaceae bacterium]